MRLSRSSPAVMTRWLTASAVGSPSAMAKLQPGLRCIMEHSNFSVVFLHQVVLRMSFVAYQDYQGKTGID